jgi:hypothetical protein
VIHHVRPHARTRRCLTTTTRSLVAARLLFTTLAS